MFGGPDDRDREFTEYYVARGSRLRATAYLLCGDWHQAEDLTQITFAKLYRNWRRIAHREVLDAYARKVLLRAFLDERRRPWRREHITGHDSPELDYAVDAVDVESRMVLRAALLALPARQRAVLVLRFWEDLPVQQVAELLGLATGTVKSLSARGLNRLRAALDTDDANQDRRLLEGLR
ncbi:SigE family RNA polymerase sigma factor [Plantactinospora sp. GCM10030261]|uniref:SigE family RNA polymerase sigma factor n=1 Tax=Plantactinospora sp. GCM10030261 TaxID=3273420 RepID=UPI00360FF4FD